MAMIRMFVTSASSTSRMLLCLLVIALCTPLAHTQEQSASVDVELSRSRLYVGDELTYQIIVRGSDNPATPTVEFPSGVRAQYHGRTSQSFTSMRSVNGRSTTFTDRRYSFQYTLTAVEEGTIVIAAPTVEIDGQQISGQTASFEALFPVRSDADDMRLGIERSEVYLNETVEVECEWWIAEPTGEFSLSSTVIPDSFEIRGAQPPSHGSGRVQFEFFGEQLVGAVDTALRDGREMQRFAFRFTITPTETGAFDLGPMRAVFTRQSASGAGYRAYVESDPVEITVMPVPTRGRPDGYSGAIGEYNLDARASNTSVNVGDPITLTLRITGSEPMVGVDDAPDIGADPRFMDRFKVASEGWRETLPRENGRRTYETTIRALNDSVQEIPPIRLPSFDPRSGRYEIYESRPIELAVNPVNEVTLSDAIVTGTGTRHPPPSSTPERIELTRAMPGLWAHGPADELLGQRGFNLGETLTNPIWAVTVASGPAAFALALVIAAARHPRHPRLRAARRAYRHSRRMARRGQNLPALRHYLGAALGVEPEALTAADARTLPVDEHTAESLRQYLLLSERSSPPGTSKPAAHDEPSSLGLLKRAHRQILRSGGAAS